MCMCPSHSYQDTWYNYHSFICGREGVGTFASLLEKCTFHKGEVVDCRLPALIFSKLNVATLEIFSK